MPAIIISICSFSFSLQLVVRYLTDDDDIVIFQETSALRKLAFFDLFHFHFHQSLLLGVKCLSKPNSWLNFKLSVLL